MEIFRYLNGKAITQEELSSLSLVTGELQSAVREAEKRVERSPKGGKAERESEILLATVMKADG